MNTDKEREKAKEDEFRKLLQAIWEDSPPVRRGERAICNGVVFEAQADGTFVATGGLVPEKPQMEHGMNTDLEQKRMKVKPTAKAKARFRYFTLCEDIKRLPVIPLVSDGYSGLECFHAHETFGKVLPCREPDLLARALNGKERHGLSVTHCAEDYVGRILFAAELKANYPAWVRKDILGRAAQIALKVVGFVPTFVRTGEDFTTMEYQPLTPEPVS